MVDPLAAIYALPLDELLEQAWALRKAHFPPELRLSAPSSKRYEADGYRNAPDRFVAISLTGRACQLRCEHCEGRLLESMRPAVSPADLRRLGDDLATRGCQGVLLSGGADSDGRVRFDGYIEAIAHLKQRGLKVITHTGLVDRRTAVYLKEAGVDQALIDIIGDEDTIREVYHLEKSPADYWESLTCLKEAGLAIAPHIVIGLHFGQIRGELEALRQVTAVGTEAIILVVLNPLPGTPMRDCPPPSPEEVGRLAAAARILNPGTRLALGCARPASRLKATMERLAIRAGINVLAYPCQESLEYARSLGLATPFSQLCCSLL